MVANLNRFYSCRFGVNWRRYDNRWGKSAQSSQSERNNSWNGSTRRRNRPQRNRNHCLTGSKQGRYGSPRKLPIAAPYGRHIHLELQQEALSRSRVIKYTCYRRRGLPHVPYRTKTRHYLRVDVLPHVPFSASNDASLVASPDGDLFLGTGSARVIYRSNDDGSSWQQVHELPKGGYLGQLVMATPISIIVSVGPSQNPPQYMAFHQSRDKGQTWNQFDLPTNGTRIENLISGGTNIYAGTSPARKNLEVVENPSVIRSINSGLSWEIASSFEDAVLVKPIYCAPDGALFAETIKDTPPQSCQLYRSNDKATTWTRCADFPFQAPFWIAGLIQDERGRYVCVGTYSEKATPSRYYTAVLRSADPLKDWELLSRLSASVDSRTPPLIRSNRTKNLYLRTQNEVLVSTNDGISWQRDFRDEEGGTPLMLIQSTSGHLLLVVFYPANETAPQSENKSKLWMSDNVK